MKPISDYINERAHNVCMVVSTEKKDQFHFQVMYDFDHLYNALAKIRKELGGARKETTRKRQGDTRVIQMKFRADKTYAAGIVIFRVYSVVPKQMIPSNGNYIALAPRTNNDDETYSDFEKYDMDSEIDTRTDAEDTLLQNGMFRNREEKGEPISGSDTECNKIDAQDIAQCTEYLGAKIV